MLHRKLSVDTPVRKTCYFCLALCFIMFATVGCMFMSSSVDTGDLLDEKRVSKIEPEGTTRSQLLNLLGPPDAVLREDGKVTLSSGVGQETLNYELAFLPFADKFKPSPYYVVFYYQSIEASSKGMVIVAAGTSKTNIQRKRLWVLMDESRSVVADYVYRND